MSQTLLINDVRPMGRDSVDMLIVDGVIARIESPIDVSSIDIADDGPKVIDGQNKLLLPGLVNAHAHLDKNLLGYAWHRNEMTGRSINDYVETERRVNRELGTSPEIQSARACRAAIAFGTTHVRSHIDVDAGVGLTNWEGALATREAFTDQLTMQLIAFP